MPDAAQLTMEERRETPVLLRITERHGVSVQRLALAAKRDASYVSRILSGQYPATADLLTALFELTADPEIIELVVGGAETVTIVPDAPMDLSHIAASAARMANQVVSEALHLSGAPTRSQRDGLILACDRALAAIAALRRDLTPQAVGAEAAA